MLHHAALATVIATGTLIYASLMHEPDLADFHASELQGILLEARPAFAENNAITDDRARFAELMMRYADAENDRMQAAAALIDPAIERQARNVRTETRDPALGLLMQYFGVPEMENLEELALTLKKRAAPLPPKLVAVQAAIESAWGTSRFATEGMNLFGHQCYSQGCGIKPLDRPESSNLEVRRFDSIGDSVAAYYQNINSHRAYRQLRATRHALVLDNAPVTAVALIPALGSYSERGGAYLRSLRTLLRSEYVVLAAETPRP